MSEPAATSTTSAITPTGSTSGAPSEPAPTATGEPVPTTTDAITPRAAACVADVAARLDAGGRAAQLLMVAVTPTTPPATLDRLVRQQQVGGVFLLGGWSGHETVTAATAALQARVTGPARLLVAADQEGGQVQALTGSGFTDAPSALAQGAMPPGRLTALMATVGTELRSAGVVVDLAPVADTVPADIGTANGPIGRFDRQFGSDPSRVSDSVTAAVGGLQSAGVAATAKHFPGLGRVTGNTDTSATGITDTVASPTDPHLEPFAAAISAHTAAVMVSSARYPELDAENPAMFSPGIVTGLLREKLGFGGLVLSDDVGAAVAVAGVPVPDRATRFVAAGGDVVLTARPETAAPMLAALTQRIETDPAFETTVDTALRRVLAAKLAAGLVTCG